MPHTPIYLLTRLPRGRRRRGAARPQGRPLTAIDLTTLALRTSQRSIQQTVENFSQENLIWRPSPRINSIGFLLWHIARVQDSIVHHRLLEQPEIWVTQGWAQRLGRSPESLNEDYSEEQLPGFVVPPKEDLLEYLNAVFDAAQRAVEGMDVEAIDLETGEGSQRSRFLVMLLTHATTHIGAIDSVRELLEERKAESAFEEIL